MPDEILPVGERLIYSSATRCGCGAGMAYVEKIDEYGISSVARREWTCSAVLKGEVQVTESVRSSGFEARALGADSQVHRALPFAFYEVRSERDRPGEPTTRPEDEPPLPTPAEEVEERRRRLPALVQSLLPRVLLTDRSNRDSVFELARILTHQPWPNRVAEEIAKAAAAALKHNPAATHVFVSLHAALRKSLKLSRSACESCQKPIESRASRYTADGRSWHLGCRPENPL